MHRTEHRFANILTAHNKTWKYHPKRFEVGDSTYEPDFYCVEDDIYIEVTSSKAAYEFNKNKYILFQKLYPNLKFTIVKPNGEPFIGDNILNLTPEGVYDMRRINFDVPKTVWIELKLFYLKQGYSSLSEMFRAWCESAIKKQRERDAKND